MALGADGTVVMPLDYWLSVARYVVDVDAVRQVISAWAEGEGD